MKTEISAGGVVVQKKSLIWHVLMLKDMNGNWTFPKGIIEKNEDPLVAAQREILEEVAISGLTLIAKLTPIHYMYTRGQPVKKIVHYFLFLYEGKKLPSPQTDEGISEVQWISVDRARCIIGYAKTNKHVLEEALWKLNSHPIYKK